jgi:hypothetical protein
VPLRGPSGNHPRERSNTSGWHEEALLGIKGGDLAAGCWQIVDRKYRLASRVAGTKGASRLLADLHLNIKYYIEFLFGAKAFGHKRIVKSPPAALNCVLQGVVGKL